MSELSELSDTELIHGLGALYTRAHRCVAEIERINRQLNELRMKINEHRARRLGSDRFHKGANPDLGAAVVPVVAAPADGTLSSEAKKLPGQREVGKLPVQRNASADTATRPRTADAPREGMRFPGSTRFAESGRGSAGAGAPGKRTTMLHAPRKRPDTGSTET